jgi:CubicO group peptidase (beta-lactamase class C family)
MAPKRRTVEFVLASLFALAIIGGSVAFYIDATEERAHRDPAAVTSVVGIAPGERNAAAAEEAGRRARLLLVDENLPSVSVAVARNGEIEWSEAFGFANLESRTPVTPRTRYRLGSVSKTLTATAVALLYERRQIDLDAPIQTYVPSYPRKRWTVTTRQLLGDVAGVHKIRGDVNDQLPRGQCTGLEQALEHFRDEPLFFEPGTQYKFSTSGWILLSAAIEGAAAEPFPTFMSKEIFKPLGMDRTALEHTDEDPDTVTYYFPRLNEDSRLGLQDAPKAEYGCFFGAGGFLSTPSDLVRLGSAMLRPGFLKQDTIDLFHTPLPLESGGSSGFALGWKVDAIPFAGTQVRVVRHRGSFIGGYSSLSLFPQYGLAVAAISSVAHTPRVDTFALEVAEAFARNGEAGSK